MNIGQDMLDEFLRPSNDQQLTLRGNLESEYFASVEDAIKAYKALQEKYQSLVQEFYRKDAEYRDSTMQLLAQAEALSQENHRISTENKYVVLLLYTQLSGTCGSEIWSSACVSKQ
ncbi:luciferase-like monooxygenase, putative [Babesia ovata]|uniref:Luciferase-like monooxygenase, putative n=1 Tax=Babesia ovata TaxID=189622 RepID=A0A2H6K926_9APIC|nr:luciferase-like monooxygenase, putative [Babesia ovata]GBE59491.1 luciferase-like monooxygenase, putative [Babesia ovata]